MQLPFFKDKTEKPEYYLALILTDEKASSVILKADLGKIKILSSHEEIFPTSIEDITLDEFINVIDKSVSKAEEILPPDVETHKTVFGVKESWIEEETKKIKKEYLAKLKKMCDSLDLTPVGFMATREAIAHLLQDKEGAPLSAIMADIGKKQVTLRLLRGGKTIESTSGAYGDYSAPATVDLLLKHFTVPVLPARIILLHTATGEELNQQFISHQWSKSLPFLHMPQITLLPPGFDTRAVTYGAATQMGLEFLDTEEKTPAPHEETDTTIIVEETNIAMSVTEADGEPISHTNEEEKPEEPQAEANEPTDEKNATAESFGFVRDQEISDVKPHAAPVHTTHHTHKEEATLHHHKPAHKEIDESIANIVIPDEDIRLEHHKTPKTSPVSLLLASSREKVSSFLAPLKKINLPFLENIQSKGNLLKFGIPAAAVLLLLIGGYLFYLYQVKVQVTLTAEPKAVDQTENIIFSTTSSSDFSKNIVAAKIISTDVEGKLTADATGKKDIGEKAKGSMTFYNSTTKEQTIAKGTTITGKSLQFTLDDTVKIASSGGASEGAKTAKGNVTAKELGKESNLPSGTKFSVSGFSTSEIEGKNDSAFSGGSKETIIVVSQADIEKLKKDLPKSLEDKAKESLAQKASSSLTVLPLLTGATISKVSSDKKAGDEAKKVTITATVSFDALGFENDELTEYSKSLLRKKFPGDANFSEKSIEKEIKNAKEKDDEEITATVLITAGLLPKIDQDDVANKIEGKSFSQAQEILTSLPQISNSEITFSPSIPLLPKLFPQLPKNIHVVIKNE